MTSSSCSGSVEAQHFSHFHTKFKIVLMEHLENFALSQTETIKYNEIIVDVVVDLTNNFDVAREKILLIHK